MDEIFEFGQEVLWLMGAIVTFGGGATVIYKGYRKYRDPIDNLTKVVTDYMNQSNARMEKLESHDLRFSKSFDSLQEVQHAQAEAMMSMLDHMSTGNHTGEMQAQKKKLYSIVCRQRKDD